MFTSLVVLEGTPVKRGYQYRKKEIGRTTGQGVPYRGSTVKRVPTVLYKELGKSAMRT